MVEKLEVELNDDENEAKGRAKFFKVDVDHSSDLAQENGVTAMPTFLVYRKTVLVKTIVGADYRGLVQSINGALKAEDNDALTEGAETGDEEPAEEELEEVGA